MAQSEITYFEGYLKGLNGFLYKESLNLTIRDYMRLIIEILAIKDYIQTLNNKHHEKRNGTNFNN